MPNTYWWSGDSDERYWCEITSREDIGNDPMCPQTDEAGRPYWSYSLIQEIQPGDFVFHYSTREKAVVGVSVATGRPIAHRFEWTPHSTVGKRNGKLDERDAWRLPVANFTRAIAPLSLEHVIADQAWVREWLRNPKRQSPIASPFVTYADTMRGLQGYLTKMPSDFVRRWAQLQGMVEGVTRAPFADAVTDAIDAEEAIAAVAAASKGRSQGFVMSATLRRAIELHAVGRAVEAFSRRDYHVEKRGKPFDLLCSRGEEILYVEVKGTTTLGEEVFLTPNEVSFARNHEKSMALFLVSDIVLELASDGQPRTSGGIDHEVAPWRIEDEDLKPLMFSYGVPRSVAPPGSHD
jgi:hypothetical protein